MAYEINGKVLTNDEAKKYCQSLKKPIMVTCLSKGKRIDERSDFVWGTHNREITILQTLRRVEAIFDGDDTLLRTSANVQHCNPAWTKSETMLEWVKDAKLKCNGKNPNWINYKAITNESIEELCEAHFKGLTLVKGGLR